MNENRSLLLGWVIGNRRTAPDHFFMTIRLPLSFAPPSPGQFVMVRESGPREPLLARPLSVFGFQRHVDHFVLELLYRVAGRGTSLFARLQPGDELTVLGPLGKGFTLPAGIKRALFVAGGVGVVPLIFLLHSGFLTAEAQHDTEKIFYLGARSADLLIGLERLRGFCELGICTDDGSHGYHGPVTAMLQRDISGYDPGETVIYACGPAPMIRALRLILKDHPIPCQVSLEERMACGLGACLGCAVAVRGLEGKREYRRVCQEGPVFDLRAVV